jgi:hypothetical protein
MALLRGAYDVHVHCGPDLLPRSQDGVELARAAVDAGMAGLLLKDHTTCTLGRAHVLNRLHPSGPRFLSALVLNPPVGGLNPTAVVAALQQGTDAICMPTYAARHFRDLPGDGGALAAYPLPGPDYAGLTVLDNAGEILPAVREILALVADHDAVLATGHLAPAESLALLALARELGVRRTLVTHASARITAMSVAQQHQAVALGATIEHCLLAIGDEGATGDLAPESLCEQIRQVGAQHVILSSDLGQVANGPIVAGFARRLDRLRRAGLREDEIRRMIIDSPHKLFA